MKIRFTEKKKNMEQVEKYKTLSRNYEKLRDAYQNLLSDYKSLSRNESFNKYKRNTRILIVLLIMIIFGTIGGAFYISSNLIADNKESEAQFQYFREEAIQRIQYVLAQSCAEDNGVVHLKTCETLVRDISVCFADARSLGIREELLDVCYQEYSIYLAETLKLQ